MSLLANDESTEEKKVDVSMKDGNDLLHLTVDNAHKDRLRISVIPPTLGKKMKRLPVMLCCVVDTSGSMGCDAVIKDENGKSECHGLSILDLTKHSIKTIVECLNKKDYLSIVSYSNEAQVVTPLTKMTKKNKKKTLAALNDLQADGQTNLWQGLFHGLEQLRTCKDMESAYHNSAVMLFTDGLPNMIPPKGHMAMLSDYMEEHKRLNCVIHTYGFGYSLDTKLLTQLAIRGNGYYSFIPDSTMVGTIFVNSLSNFCCNVAKNVVLRVAMNTKKEYQIVGGYPHQVTAKGIEINIGNVMYGQSKEVIIRWAPNKEGGDVDVNDTSIALSYISLRNNKAMDTNAYADACDKRHTQRSYYRLMSCDVLREAMQSIQSTNEVDAAQAQLKQLIKEIEMIQKDAYLSDLMTDLKGQCFEAISAAEVYDKWGKHYLPSLIFAHLHQHCNNFKDPGVQHYGGALFKQLRDKANDIFIGMAAPKSSYKPPEWLKEFGDVNAQAVRQPNVAMSHYMNASGGCFEGHALVLMEDESVMFVQDLKVGDRVHNGAKVECVIKYECADGKSMLTTLREFNELKITPFHPIKMMGEWVFPMDVSAPQQEQCDFVFNVVLSDHHILVVNGVECCSLAHGFKDNQVIQHAYFGTDKIIADLRKCSGWSKGEIVLPSDAFQRDPNSGLVCALKQK
eukprot:479600_1